MSEEPSEVARLVNDILGRVLGKLQPDLAEDFWANGGTSLLAVQAATLFNDEFGIEVSPLEITDAPNLAVVASLIAERSSKR